MRYYRRMTPVKKILCAVIQRGKIVGIAPVSSNHLFGDRDDYVHVAVRVWDEIPEKYNGPLIER